MCRCDGASARALQHEAARAVGVLGEAGAGASLSKECGLLIAGDARDRNAVQSRRQNLLLRKFRWRAGLSGNIDAGTRKRSRRSSSQLAGMEIEEHGAGGVAGVGDVHSAAGELPEQPGIDGAEGKAAGFGELRARRDVVRESRRSCCRRSRRRSAGRYVAG